MMHSHYFLLLSAGALALALPYDTTSPEATAVEWPSTNLPTATETPEIPSTAAALTNNTDEEPHILPRVSHYGWIASYDNGGCTGHHHKNRPKIHSGCQKFTTETDFVGLSWGSWPLGFKALDVFTDEDCTEYAAKTIKNPGWNDAEGPSYCLQVSKHGKPWKSIMAVG